MAGRNGPVGVPLKELPARLRAALAQLAEARSYARDAQRDVWDFAVEITALHALGLTTSDLRWLACKGYIEHAREVTQPGEDGRAFRPTSNLTFTKRTCCVLTPKGLSFLEGMGSDGTSGDSWVGRVDSPSPTTSEPSANGRNDGRLARPNRRPVWSAQHRELRLAGLLVKRFRWRAPNQETLLAVFEEEEWPHRIDDPLPRMPEQDPRRRLHDTIKCLNRNQEHRLIRFHGDGTGEGVVWELLEAALRASR